MEIPISFHEVAKFLPSYPFRGSHLLSCRDVFDKSTNLFVRPRGKSLDHFSRYVNRPADYKGFNLEGAKERQLPTLSISNRACPASRLACVYPRRLL